VHDRHQRQALQRHRQPTLFDPEGLKPGMLVLDYCRGSAQAGRIAAFQVITPNTKGTNQ
jgi:hypothetical protein